MNIEIAAALQTQGIISRRTHPELIGAIDHAVKTKALLPLFPGSYATDREFTTLVLALMDWDPDAVLVAGSAATLTWWPERTSLDVEAVTRRKLRRSVPNAKVSQRFLHHDLVMNRKGVNIQHPSASVLDLAREIGPEAIDEGLRRRAVTLASLRWASALMRGRKGNPLLQRYLHESRDEPWSHLERKAHEQLRRARISGWKANYLVRLRSGTVFLDAAFPGKRLGLEFDGWEFHGDRVSFTRDRTRDNELVMAGWKVLRFTADSMHEMVPLVRRFLGS